MTQLPKFMNSPAPAPAKPKTKPGVDPNVNPGKADPNRIPIRRLEPGIKQHPKA